jgi:hypothetical protein
MRFKNPLLVAQMIAIAAFSSTGIIAQTTGSNSKAALQAGATIVKPKARSVTGGGCRILKDGTFSGTWGPSALPTLAMTIGPGATMGDQMHASKAKFTGPGRYTNEIVAVYLGKTALEESYAGLGTVVIGADGHSGTFVLNDGTASGRFDCGVAPSR